MSSHERRNAGDVRANDWIGEEQLDLAAVILRARLLNSD
jgi:hypothetical protein